MIAFLKANWKQLCYWPDLEAWLLLCQTKFLLNSLDHLEKRPVLGCCAGRGWGWLPPSGGKGGFSLTLWAVNTGGGGAVAIIIFQLLKTQSKDILATFLVTLLDFCRLRIHNSLRAIFFEHATQINGSTLFTYRSLIPPIFESESWQVLSMYKSISDCYLSGTYVSSGLVGGFPAI